MLSSLSPYSVQGFMPSLPGFPGGSPQLGGSHFLQYDSNPYAQTHVQGLIGQIPGTHKPYAQSPYQASAYGNVPADAQQIAATLGQLAQQISVQSAVAQQVCVALQQIAQHLSAQSLQGRLGGLGYGSYGAFNPQQFNPQLNPQLYAQGWGANRQQTIQ